MEGTEKVKPRTVLTRREEEREEKTRQDQLVD